MNTVSINARISNSKNKIGGRHQWHSTLASGRWHQAGKSPIVYTSSNVSLAILECVVHLPPSVKPPDLVLLTLEIADAAIVNMVEADLPENWDKKGYHDNVQRWGTAWLMSLTSRAIAVPSVASPDYNILLNPTHRGFGSITIINSKSITLDDRLI